VHSKSYATTSYAPEYSQAPSSGTPGVTSWRYAPIATVSFARTARIFPSDVAASSISWIWSRPWIVAW